MKGIHSEAVRFHAKSHRVRCSGRGDDHGAVAQQPSTARKAHNQKGNRHVRQFDSFKERLQISGIFVGLVRGK